MFDLKPGENIDPNAINEAAVGYKDILLMATNVAQITDSFKVAIQKSGENLFKMDKDMVSLAKGMGVTSEYSQLLKQELGRAVTEVTLMGGKQSDINALQKEFNEATNRTIVLSTENIEKLFAVSQVSGVAVKALETGFRNAGMETTHISEEMKTVYHTANSLGVNAQTVSTMVVANLDKMNRYGFGTGVEGMAKMAAKAAAMRIDISQTMAVADKLFSPESAIEVASTLQRLGATSSALLDPLKLMDLAQNNVPELQNQLSELSKTFTKFDKETGKFQIMPEARRQLKEVADALGIDRTEFEKMALESAKLEKKMGEIDFSRLNLTNIDEDQKMMLANLAEFNKGTGDYTVKFTDDKGVAVEKALSALEDGDLEKIKLQQQTLDPQKELVDVAKQQLGAANTLVAQSASLNATIQTQYSISKAGTDLLLASVESQKNILKPGFDTYTLDKEKQTKKFGEETFGGVSKIIKGDVDVNGAISILTNIATGTIETFQEIANAQFEAAEKNPLAASIGLAISNVDVIAETFGTSTDEITKNANKIITGLSTIVTTAGLVFGFGNKELKIQSLIPKETDAKAPETPPLGGVPPVIVREGDTSQVNKIEHKIEVTIKTEINNTEVAAAVTRAFNSDDIIRGITDNIIKVSSNYGLTDGRA
jgi:hypothetical protein